MKNYNILSQTIKNFENNNNITDYNIKAYLLFIFLTFYCLLINSML